MDYKFIHNNKEYLLSEDNFDGMFFDEDNEISGLTLYIVLKALNEGTEVNFTNQYYVSKCPCGSQEQVNKSYCYLEYQFYIYTKDNQYVINNICSEYGDKSFSKLVSLGEVDKSFIASIVVCPECGLYYIDVTECEV